MGGCLRRRWGLGESISFFFSLSKILELKIWRGKMRMEVVGWEMR